MKSFFTLLTLLFACTFVTSQAFLLDSTVNKYLHSDNDLFKTIFSYDDNDVLSGLTLDIMDEDGFYISSEEYQVDEEGRVIFIESLEADILFEINEATQINYIGNDSIVLISYNTDEGADTLSKSINMIKLNSKGKVSVFYDAIIQNGTDTILFERIEHYYTNDEVLDSLLFYSNDFDSQSLLLDDRWIYHYEDSNLSKIEKYMKEYDTPNLYLALEENYSNYVNGIYGKKDLKEFYPDGLAFIHVIDSIVFDELDRPYEEFSTVLEDDGTIVQSQLTMTNYFADGQMANTIPLLNQLYRIYSVESNPEVCPILSYEQNGHLIKNQISYEYDVDVQEYQAMYQTDFYYNSISNTNEIAEIKDIKVNPNPAVDYLNLDNRNNGNTFLITDFSGRLIRQGKVERNRIDIKTLSSGIFILQVTGKDNELYRTKFIKL